ncbi:MAG: hypothetical protein EZS28_028962 [Streblomastix strix]|uniref:Uncharacterized protein n=1 Tax=Streblomastix strix TaxID=222440 RepID=A0A5J4V0C1_9EUKA|nr:MAG: hypothetical protein EZS28_028962 [Streblomastix strix]
MIDQEKKTKTPMKMLMKTSTNKPTIEQCFIFSRFDYLAHRLAFFIEPILLDALDALDVLDTLGAIISHSYPNSISRAYSTLAINQTISQLHQLRKWL